MRDWEKMADACNTGIISVKKLTVHRCDPQKGRKFLCIVNSSIILTCIC
jgi:hypothetical protein